MPVPLLPDRPVGGEIPRILHQVWVGSPPPTWVRENWARWDEILPDWIRYRWVDENADQWPLSSLAARQHNLPHIVVLADLIRLEQVWKHGGVYLDCDTVPFRDLTPMTGKRSGWIAQGGWERDPNGKKEIELNNAIFGFEAHSPFLQTVWEQAIGALDKKSAYHIAGPKRFEQVYPVFQDVIDLPPWQEFPDLPRGMTVEQARERWPEAYLVHTADKSWYGENHSTHNTPTFIMAVPWVEERRERAEDLKRETQGKIVWDTDHHAFHTWRSVLKALGSKPGIIIEDDVVLAPNWRNRIEDVIREHPDEVIQFFSMRGADLTVGSRSEPGRTFMMNQCYYLPAGAAKQLLDFTEDWDHVGQENPTGYDVAMAEWMKVTKRRYWLHVPSLVQHEPWRSEINSRRPRNRQSETFA